MRADFQPSLVMAKQVETDVGFYSTLLKILDEQCDTKVGRYFVLFFLTVELKIV